MPVAIKLSKRFYDTFGQEVTNELVDALNAVDTSYRAEFRELFSAHFGQLRAEMERLAAQLRGEMNQLGTELRGEMKQLELRLDARIDRLEGRMTAFEQKLSGDLKAMKSHLVAWMVGLWFATAGLAILARIFWEGS